MNTKEVIKVFKRLIRDKEIYKLRDNEVDFYCEVVELLEQGEKYKQMWGELCNRNVNDSDEYVYSWTEELFELMVEIQQKYFPKEVKTNV